MRKAIPYANSICLICGNSFTVSNNEMPMLPDVKSHVFLRPPVAFDKIYTWDDWVKHITSYCRLCRLPSPPPKAKEDYQKRINKINETKR